MIDETSNPTMTLNDLLHFRGQALTQFVLVATIFGAFAMSGVIALIARHERARLRSALFVLLSIASLAFVFATVLSVMILPFMNSGTPISEKAMRGLLFLYSIVITAIVIGTALLAASLALMGFLVSRRVGVWTTAATALVTLVFGLCIVELVYMLR